MYAITEHVARTDRHTTFYLACGAADATPLDLCPWLAGALDQLASSTPGFRRARFSLYRP